MFVGQLIVVGRRGVDGLAAFPESCLSRRRGDTDIFEFNLSEDLLFPLVVGDLDLRLTTDFCEFFEEVPDREFLPLEEICRFLGGVGDLPLFLGGVGDRLLSLGGVGDLRLFLEGVGERFNLRFFLPSLFPLLDLESVRFSLIFLPLLDSGSGEGVERREDSVDAQADEEDDDEEEELDDMAAFFSSFTIFLPMSSLSSRFLSST